MWSRLASYQAAAVCLLLSAGLGFAQEKYPADPEMPAYELPEVLKLNSGEPVTTAEAWQQERRSEVLELFRRHVYGRVPATKYQQTFHVVHEDAKALGGAATLRQVEIRIAKGEKSLAIRVNLFVPNGAKQPVPAFVLICNRGAENIDANRGAENIDATRATKSEFWPVEEGIARGYAMAAFLNADVDPDKHDEFQNGIHGLLDEVPRGDDAWGTIAAWAWGASRVLDYLLTVPEINPKQIGVIGHSRGGKTALWAAAEDERFAMAVSNDSGCGGASLSRRRFKGREQVARITTAFPHWFCAKFKTYAEREDELPIDQHQLIALIAPRAVAVGSASEDVWADPRGEFLSVVHAAPVYKLLGHDALETSEMPPIGSAIHGDRMHYHLRPGKH
ncbi:MAG: acetylxylan esterase, partial [Pirellulaceae bacterium]|nr:acetylxylan esterase [Pirellulaceae bacterium]